MRKKMGIGTLTITTLLFLAGCASNQPSATSSPSSTTNNNQAPAPNSSKSSIARPSSIASSTKLGSTAAVEKPVNSNEQPLAPEKNPVGDIPDSQAFVTYTSSKGGYSFAAPEGWSRTENGTDVSFTDKFGGVKTVVSASSSSLTLDNLKKDEMQNVVAKGRAVQIVETKEVTLPGGKVVEVKFNSNSDPNPVTNKQIRLENESFYFTRNGKLAAFTLWAPLGADNVDQWRKMAESWRWK